MTKTKSIRKFCLTCFGESLKDIVFCTDPKCPLWEHRLGTDLRSTKGIEIMTKYCQKYPKDFMELAGYGVDSSLYLPRTPRRIGKKPLNKGLQSVNSRHNRLALQRVAGKTDSPSYIKKCDKNPDNGKPENGSSDQACRESPASQASVDRDSVTIPSRPDAIAIESLIESSSRHRQESRNAMIEHGEGREKEKKAI